MVVSERGSGHGSGQQTDNSYSTTAMVSQKLVIPGWKLPSFEVLGVPEYPGAVHVLGCEVHSFGVNPDSDSPVPALRE